MKPISISCLPFLFLSPLAPVMALAPLTAAHAQTSGMGAPAMEAEPAGAAELRAAMQGIARNPQDPVALTDAGNASLQLGDEAAAESFFRRALAQDPRNGRAVAGLAKALLANENPFEALKLFDQAIKLGEPEAAIAEDRGLAFDLIGNFDLAQRDYQLAGRGRDPQELTVRRAVSLGIAGRTSESERMLVPLLSANYAPAWRARAFLLAAQGKTEEAVRIARGFLPAATVEALKPFFQRMADLTPSQQVAAIQFGHFPAGAAIGRDSAAIRIANAGTGQTGKQGGTNRLVPTGKPLGKADNVAQAAPLSPSELRRQKREAEKKQREAEKKQREEARLLAQQNQQGRTLAASAANRQADALRMPEPPPPMADTPPVSAPSVSAPPVSAPQMPAPRTQIAVASVPVPASAPAPRLPVQQAPVQQAPVQQAPLSQMERVAQAQSSATAAPKQTPPVRLTLSPPPPVTPAAPAYPVRDAVAPSPVTPSPVVPAPVAAPPAAVPAYVPSVEPVEPQPEPRQSLFAIVSSIAIPEEEKVRDFAPVDLAALPVRPVLREPAKVEKPAPADKPVVAKAADKTLDKNGKPVKPDAKAEKAALAEKKAKEAKELKAKEAKEAKAKEAEKAKQPARIWYQLATGSNVNALAFDYRKLVKANAALFGKMDGWTSAWGSRRRLLIGPFAKPADAKKFEAAYTKAGGKGFIWQSTDGLVVEKLPAK